jgi:hypothetical protein
MLGIGGGESYAIKQSGLWIQRDHTLDIESVLLADGVKGRVLIQKTFAQKDICPDRHLLTRTFALMIKVHRSYI